ncbi:RNA helicase [Malassezia sp. CBS 17886]|nr:RNA helicase [Malassezia sp. CBS 17886]
MAKKKKPTLKGTVNRGFATTSVPRKDAEASGGGVERPGSPTSPAQRDDAAADVDADVLDAAGRDDREHGHAPHTFNAAQEEEQALQNLVDLVHPRVEKESQRRLRTIEHNQRMSRALPTLALDMRAVQDIVEFARGDADGEDASDALLGEVLGAASEAPERTLDQALTTRELLADLGFSAELMDRALVHAPSLDVEECVAWLFTQLSERDARQYRMNLAAPNAGTDDEPAARLATEETRPPMHRAYAFERVAGAEALAPTAGAPEPEQPRAALSSITPATREAVCASLEALATELRALLDSDTPWVDAIEHPVDAWCTGRIALMQLDQERAKRRKLLGAGPLEAALSEAVDAAKAEKTLTRLSEQAKELMQRSEMQPAFLRPAAQTRFRERMQLRHEQQGRAQEAAARNSAQRASDLARLRDGNGSPAQPGDGVADAPDEGVAHAANKHVTEVADETVTCAADTRVPHARDAPACAAEPMNGVCADARATSPRAHDAADSDSDLEVGALQLLDEGAEEETEPASGGATVAVRPMSASSGSFRAPRHLLSDALHQMDPHAHARFSPLQPAGSVKRSQLEIRWTNNGRLVRDTYRLTGEGCSRQAMADDLVATAALNALARGRNAQRALSTDFRTFWDELEACRKKERDEHLRAQFTHVQSLLKQREEQQGPARSLAKRATNAPGTHTSSPASPPRRAEAATPQPSLIDAYASLTAQPRYQAMLQAREQLPIAHFRRVILDTVAQSQVVVLSGETGCGKSTQLPAYLMEDCMARGEPCRIYVTEPRRISALSLAQRVSQELGEAPGAVGTNASLVGYAIRLENRVGRYARLVYATTGIVLRMLESSAFADITHMIVDEVHERSIESDFLLIVLKTLLTQRPHMKVVLMSATLDAERISAYFGDCPMLSVPGRTFPVDVRFLEDALELVDYTLDENSPYARRDMGRQNRVGVASTEAEDEEDADEDEQASSAPTDRAQYRPKTVETLARLNEYVINHELIVQLVERICTDPELAPMSGAILVFFPGMGDIRQCLSLLSAHPRLGGADVQVHVLHSAIASETQNTVFDVPPPGVRKIVLATNIAETGITIPDITCVIDTGKHREMRYDEKRKISKLVDCFVARSNAKQRRGRAGRVQHGLCFHLFTRMRHDELLDAHPLPEMLRLSLQELALKLKVMPVRIGDSVEGALAQALDPPLTVNVQRAVAALVEVHALTANEDITPLGRHLCHMPLDVHLSKFLLVASFFRCADTALTIAAMLSAKSPFVSSMSQGTHADRHKDAFDAHNSDFFALATMFRGWRRAVARQAGRKYCAAYSLSQEVLYQIEELRQQYFGYLVDTGFLPVDDAVRTDLARARGRGGARPRLLEVPPALDEYGECAPVVTLALAVGLYPKMLQIDRRTNQMRTLTNNQPAAVHPSSVNFRKPLQSPNSARHLMYYTILLSKRLYAWETALVDDVMLMLLCGDAEYRHTSRSVFLDHTRVRMAFLDSHSLVALRILRDQLTRAIHASFRTPYRHVFELVLRVLGVARPVSQ